MGDDHQHCWGCVNSFCSSSSGCPVEYCRNGCGASFHGCKREEHERHVCQESLVPCTNSPYGCKERMARKGLNSHLSHCPASLVWCRMVHERAQVDNPGEMALQGADGLIDEKMLSGDLNQLATNPEGKAPPTLGISIENSGHGVIDRRKRISKRIRQYRYNSPEPKRELVPFVCGQMVRRDEFVPHWERFHLDMQLNHMRVVQRCTLLSYGCLHGRENLVPSPGGTSLSYDGERDTFLVTSPSPVVPEREDEATRQLTQYEEKIKEKEELALYGYGEDEEEGYDVLSQLPAEILLRILGLLDSVSLWNLSLVSHSMRRVCSWVVQKRGMVFSRWSKVDDPGCLRGYKWTASPRVWSFSKVSDNMTGWNYTDSPALCAHLLSCEVYKSLREEWVETYTQRNRIPMPGLST